MKSNEDELLAEAIHNRKIVRAANITALAALFWSNVHKTARQQGGYKNLFSSKGAKALLARTLKNFFGLKQGDDDTFMRRLGRAGLNWTALFTLLWNNNFRQVNDRWGRFVLDERRKTGSLLPERCTHLTYDTSCSACQSKSNTGRPKFRWKPILGIW